MLTAQRIWRQRDASSELIHELEHELNVSALSARLLAIRGVRDPQHAQRFLNKRLKDLYAPELMRDMDVAARRLATAIKNRERILIHGDYDVDGSTASSLLCLFARACNHQNIVPWIPHRRIEGYGLSAASLKAVQEHQATLMITVDCGIADSGWAQKIEQQCNCDVIITDHHLPQKDLPQCTAICNPNHPDCNYPDKGICGVAVAWKLCWACAKILSGGDKVTDILRTFLMDSLPLVAIGTVADCAPLNDENRIIVHHGLKHLQESSYPGLQALLRQTGLTDGPISASDIGWKIGPLINASGRLGSAMRNVTLLCSTSDSEAETVMKKIVTENEERRRLTALLSEELLAEIEGNPDYLKRSSLVFAGERWHQGIVGIVAGRITERFAKPCAVIGIENGVGKGSLRTVKHVHLANAIDHCRQYLISGGGHAMAAGITISPDNVNDFSAAFEEYVKQGYPEGLPQPGTDFDGTAEIHELNAQFFQDLEAMAPFGIGNSEPVIRLNKVRFVSKPDLFGQTHTHVRGSITSDQGGMHKLLAWKSKDSYSDFSSPGSHFSFLVRPQLNYWRGNSTPQLIFIDGEHTHKHVGEPA